MGRFNELMIDVDELELPMTIEGVIKDMRDTWDVVAYDLLVDDDGEFDDRMTYSGSELQDLVPELWVANDPTNFDFFNKLLSDKKFQPIWENIKHQAFPDDAIYGA